MIRLWHHNPQNGKPSFGLRSYQPDVTIRGNGNTLIDLTVRLERRLSVRCSKWHRHPQNGKPSCGAAPASQRSPLGATPIPLNDCPVRLDRLSGCSKWHRHPQNGKQLFGLRSYQPEVTSSHASLLACQP